MSTAGGFLLDLVGYHGSLIGHDTYNEFFSHCWRIVVLRRMILVACFGPGPFALDTAIEIMIRESFWNFVFLEEGVGVQEKCVPAMFLQTKVDKEQR